MAENGSKPWLMWLVGFVATILMTAVFTMANAVVNNDQMSRSRDDQIKECMQKSNIEQQQVNQQILVSLTEIKSDLKWIKNNGK